MLLRIRGLGEDTHQFQKHFKDQFPEDQGFKRCCFNNFVIEARIQKDAKWNVIFLLKLY